MYQQPNLIGTNVPIIPNQSNPSQMQQFSLNKFLPKLQQFRAAGNIAEYSYDSIKPKKKLKEIKKILYPEKKSFLKIKYSFKFNFKDICVVCGTHHAGIHKQMEMLQQQILAEEHGLDFKAFIPKARMPKMLSRSGPLTTLSKEDVLNLTAGGWFIKPPAITDNETTMAEIVRLVVEIGLTTERLNFLIGNKEE